MEYFHRSLHVNIFMWISHAAILPVYKFVSRFRKLLWQDPYIFMLLHVFVKKMYSHKQSIEQKYYVRVEYALKKSYHYQRPCLSPLFKTGKNPNSCFSFVCLFCCCCFFFFATFPYLFGLFTPLPFPIPQFYHATAFSLFMRYIKYTIVTSFVDIISIHYLRSMSALCVRSIGWGFYL